MAEARAPTAPPPATATATVAPSVATATVATPATHNGAPVQTSVTRFVNAVPKLERKHSSGDLHSRLKTRKVLGVGATDNGDVHRSKISQVLGHNEHLYVRFPRGLLHWYLMLTAGLGLQGSLLTLSPSWAVQLSLLTAQQPTADVALIARGYGVTLLGLSHLLYAVWSTSDKVIIRSGLGVLAITDAVAIGTHLVAIFQTGTWSRWSLLHMGLRGISAGVNLIYLNLSRNYYAGTARKAPSPAAPSYADMDARKKSL